MASQELFRIAAVLAKVLTFAVSMSTGFIGGTIFPMIFIGGTAETALHAIIPDVPVALAVTCGMAGVAGAAAKAPPKPPADEPPATACATRP